MKGKFITFEGGEGSGKSTQAKIVCDMLKSHYVNFIRTREPGGTIISEKIRELVLNKEYDQMTHETEILLFAASRAQLVNEVIKPALEEGKLVVCDRFVDSSFVYQGLTNDDNLDKVIWANKYVMENCMPDVTLYFDIDPEIAFARKNGADKADRIETKGMNFHKKVREGFLKLSKMFPERIKVIDASKSLEEVTAQIFEVLRAMNI